MPSNSLLSLAYFFLLISFLRECFLHVVNLTCRVERHEIPKISLLTFSADNFFGSELSHSFLHTADMQKQPYLVSTIAQGFNSSEFDFLFFCFLSFHT